ncbi:hypothetical protein [Mucilaginibacter auburnensis]|uniref:Uncharacterized protein n=1 Tax=Mucilaginibacter auburnensis TaxID=1457233 RepID=A0A2H9VTG8_9SPHI|nr:hypothetical protein [Mucilaginibacter auburnensis]PJJ84111.1 hypothetical protein CLV57_1115 [Mucilaginibacter auburnensis]
MKYYIATLCLVLLIKSTYGQDYLREKNFINQVIIKKNIVYQDSLSRASSEYLQYHLKYARELIFSKRDADSLIYIDSAGRETRMIRSKAMARMEANERPGVSNGRILPIIRDTIILSEQEITHILSQFEKESKRKWNEDLIPGARQINTDTINAVFKDRIWGWEKMHNKGVPSIHTFGPPVFIRDDKYCIFYSDNTCGYRCGSGKLAIYKKENGKWTFWGDIITWVS